MNRRTVWPAFTLWCWLQNPEGGVSTQPALQFGHLNLILVCLFFSVQHTHTTPHSFAFLRILITILRFQPTGGRGWHSPWGSARFMRPSAPWKSWIRGAQSRDFLLSIRCLSLSLFLSLSRGEVSFPEICASVTVL